MSKVDVEAEECEVENEDGIPVEGLCVTCTRCDHEVTVFGQGDKSLRRACIMLREECPLNQENYYVAE